MKFSIDNSIFEAFPDVCIGLVVASDIDNTQELEQVMTMLRKKQQDINTSFTPEKLAEHPNIIAWKQAYSTFGGKPKKYRCSVDNLYRMTLEGIQLPHINTLVDIYNYISLTHVLPVGGDDIDHIDGDIVLTRARGDENFTELNSTEMKHPKEGEVVYRDANEILCRRWNWRECDKSKMTTDTKNAVLVVEGLPPTTQENIEAITRELADLIKEHCGATTETHILSKEHPETELI